MRSVRRIVEIIAAVGQIAECGSDSSSDSSSVPTATECRP